MKIREFCDYLDGLYPRCDSCEWDNDGLMCCVDTSASVEKVLVALDATEQTIAEASTRGCNVLLTHHPMIFRGVRSVNCDELVGRRIIRALRENVTVISLHTRFDAGEKGVNDCLVRALGYESAGTFGDSEAPSLGRYFDLDEPLDAGEFALRCKDRLGVPYVTLYGCGAVRRICVVGGSGGDFIAAARDIGADLLLTGECSYNRAADAAESGLCVLEAGHFGTENPACKRLAEICCTLDIPCEIYSCASFETF